MTLLQTGVTRESSVAQVLFWVVLTVLVDEGALFLLSIPSMAGSCLNLLPVHRTLGTSLTS